MEIEKQIEEQAKTKLVGKKITAARYMTAKEARDCGFYDRPFVLILDSGEWICPSRDEEGNGAGTLFTSILGSLNTIGPMRQCITAG